MTLTLTLTLALTLTLILTLTLTRRAALPAATDERVSAASRRYIRPQPLLRARPQPRVVWPQPLLLPVLVYRCNGTVKMQQIYRPANAVQP